MIRDAFCFFTCFGKLQDLFKIFSFGQFSIVGVEPIFERLIDSLAYLGVKATELRSYTWLMA